MEKTHTIIYVFGPAQCEDKYMNGERLERELNEWVKIGETSASCDLNDVTYDFMKAKAMDRILHEVRTGIPVQAKIYDLFIFPYRVQTDELLRSRLCDDMFDVENSKAINKANQDSDIIPAGREFVYGVTRDNIKFAVQSWDHDLLVAAVEGGGNIEEIVKICVINNISVGDGAAQPTDASIGKGTRNSRLNLDMILNVGDPVTLVKGKTIVTDGEGNPVTARYAGNMKFERDGELKCGTPLAIELLEKFGYKSHGRNGNDFWAVVGADGQYKKLWELRAN